MSRRDLDEDRAARAMERRANISTGLALLNPWQLVQIVKQIRGDRAASARADPSPSFATNFHGKTELRWPARGEWLVAGGGPDPETSHSWEIVGQRYALDIVQIGADEQTFGGDGQQLGHYHCYGAPILAPADGEVVVAHDGIRDARRPGTGWLDWRARHFCGNHVTIDHGNGEFSFLAHLKTGSLTVKVGDRVGSGTKVGRCGNSGHSTQPHLHFQLQDHPDFFQAVGLPMRFAGIAVGPDEHADGYPRGGDIVTSHD